MFNTKRTHIFVLISIFISGILSQSSNSTSSTSSNSSSNSSSTGSSSNSSYVPHKIYHNTTSAYNQTTHHGRSFYNVLALDGGSYRDYVTALVVQYMEQYAYNYSLSMGFIGENDKKKVHMSQLFDMISGTSTNGLLVAALITPNSTTTTNGTNTTITNTPMYYSDDVISVYETEGEIAFQDQSINDGLLGIMIFFSAIIGFTLGLMLGNYVYDNIRVERSQYLIRQYIKELKKELENKGGEEDTSTKQENQTQSALSSLLAGKIAESIKKQFHEKYREELSLINEGKSFTEKVESNNYWQVREAESILERSALKYKSNKQKKWIFVTIGCILGGLFGYFVPGWTYELSYSKYDRTGFDNIVDSMFINSTFDNILTDEGLIIGYSYNMQQPRFYSKHFLTTEPLIYNVSIATATKASISTIGYFDPFYYTNPNGTNETLVDGSVIAENPSMYSILHAGQYCGKTDIRLVSIGSTMETPATIDKKMSALDWLSDLTDLMTTTEITTHTYLSRQYAEDFTRFQLIVNATVSDLSPAGIEQLRIDANDIIQTSGDKIREYIEELCDDKLNRTSAIKP